MIAELGILNLGVIAEAKASFGPGLTAITGETGAGKTMLTSGLNLALGAKADVSLVRSGAAAASVEAVFVPDGDQWKPGLVTQVLQAGAVLDDEQLFVSRQLPVQGRSRCYLGGRSVPSAVVSELGESLVSIHGQAEQLLLRSAARQRQVLDNYGGYGQLLADYRQAWAQYTQAQAELAQAQTTQESRLGRISTVSHYLQQLLELNPVPGEDTELAAEIQRLGNAEELQVAAATASHCLDGNEDGQPGAVANLGLAVKALQTGGKHDPELAELGEQLTQAQAIINDAAFALATYLSTVQADPGRLEQLHARRATLRQLSIALQVPADELAEKTLQLQAEYDQLTGPGQDLQQLIELVDQALTHCTGLGEELSQARRRAAKELASSVSQELAALSLANAVFTVQVEPGVLGPWGKDEVAYLFVAQKQGPPRPLAQVASGGELSRIMLAIEVVNQSQTKADDDTDLPTLIFDEIDAGIGGKTALEVGKRLALLADKRQVIVVTHLPQVAAWASSHLVVTKDDNGTTTVKEALGAGRELELARMLSGQDTKTALRHAAELLKLTKMG